MGSESRRAVNAMTVDVEEHFQVSAFEGSIDRSAWPDHPSRVMDNTRRLLDLFDECATRATFFVLGWVAERRPELAREIVDRGHELACHGYSHRLIYTQERGEFAEETRRARELLEDAAGQEVRGYRAASFSIREDTLWALDVLAECGFTYDSSLFPVVHDRYGIPGSPRGIHVRATAAGPLIEIPPSTVRVAGMVLPALGGGYLRLYPTRVTRWALSRINDEGMPGLVYVHPWEVDPDQPRVDAPLLARFRHYNGLRRTAAKLRDLMQRFRFGRMCDVLDGVDGVAMPAHTLAGSHGP